SAIAQEISIPAGQSVLSYYYWIGSGDLCGYDTGYIYVDGDLLKEHDLCENTNTLGWVRGTVNLSAYTNRTVLLEFVVETDDSLNSNLFIDDVALGSNLAAAAQPEPDAVPADATASKD